eukprot:CAMPEP_0185599638 /NCGR_PEP_ID=MMETSP0434-20130131/82839_1 /TAXON_ID=626734 ORGANISM="Favella taraikaensis, Strain Fe Narragansett Bay" /NCGR_SAMPLE_ID=MMETSP0434 /ASSEMBLY_ACC=CAM_ASM_000379 /LENGTH=172 /DNA_ID=CAMNT_0028229107 /DNA_START=1220 /DNA_END=1738 /DNA_ORIENTATION=+
MIVGENRKHNHCQEVVYDYLQRGVVKQEECRCDKSTTAPEEDQKVEPSFLIFVLDIFSIVEGPIALLCFALHEIVFFVAEHTGEDNRCSIDQSKDADRDCVVSRSRIVESPEHDHSTHVKFQRVENHVSNDWIEDHFPLEVLDALAALFRTPLREDYDQDNDDDQEQEAKGG